MADQIRQRFEAENIEVWEEHRIEPVRFIDAGEQVVVIQHEYQRGKGSGVEIEIDTASVFDFRGGRIVRIQPYMNPAAALEAVGLRSCSPPTGLRPTNTPCTANRVLGKVEASPSGPPSFTRTCPAARSPAALLDRAGHHRVERGRDRSKYAPAAPPVAEHGTVSLCSKATTVAASFAGRPACP